MGGWLVEYSVLVSEGEDMASMDGYKYCLLLFGSQVLAAFCSSGAAHLTGRLFLRIRNSLVIALYYKSLRVPTRIREDGKLNNLAASDTEMLTELSSQINVVWSAPIIIGVGMWELYNQVGWCAFVGLAIIIASMPFTALLLRNYGNWTKKESIAADRRIGLTNEVVAGIRVVKYYAWERPFLVLLTNVREEQIVWLRKMILSSCLFFGASSLTSSASTMTAVRTSSWTWPTAPCWVM